MNQKWNITILTALSLSILCSLNATDNESYKPLAQGIKSLIENTQLRTDLTQGFAKYIQSSLTTPDQKQQARKFLMLLQEGLSFDWKTIQQQMSTNNTKEDQKIIQQIIQQGNQLRQQTEDQLADIQQKEPYATIQKLHTIEYIEQLRTSGKNKVEIDLEQLQIILTQAKAIREKFMQNMRQERAKLQQEYEKTKKEIPAELQKFINWQQQFTQQLRLLMSVAGEDVTITPFVDLLQLMVQAGLDALR